MVSAFQCRVHYIVVESLCRGVARGVSVFDKAKSVIAAVEPSSLHGPYGGTCVPGGLYFRHYFDAHIVGCAYQVYEVFACEVPVGNPCVGAWIAVSGKNCLRYVRSSNVYPRCAPTSVNSGSPGISRRHASSSVIWKCSRLRRLEAIRANITFIVCGFWKLRAISIIRPRHGISGQSSMTTSGMRPRLSRRLNTLE